MAASIINKKSKHFSIFQISQQMMSSKTFSYVTLNFTHHAACACQRYEKRVFASLRIDVNIVDRYSAAVNML